MIIYFLDFQVTPLLFSFQFVALGFGDKKELTFLVAGELRFCLFALFLQLAESVVADLFRPKPASRNTQVMAIAIKISASHCPKAQGKQNLSNTN
mmetsp:Transcript_2078/g.4908  ORF Transcript_2078/g.4908 Transcript_2078/m.4908 type:complete len:95 (-) Transcript_2078:16-300(-)